MKRSSPSKPNAFAILMGSQKKQKTVSSSRSVQVPCPAGCGKQVLERDVNLHLDFCILKGSSSQQRSNHDSTTDQQQQQHQQQGSIAMTMSASNEWTPQNTASTGKHKHKNENENDCSNAFTHMMRRSVKVFSSSEEAKLAERFHLNSDGSLSVTCYCTYPGLSQPDNIQWSTNVLLKPTKRSATNENVDEDQVHMAVDVSLSSAIATAPRKLRLVQRHSRLSIPVLKSILQKAIRRRRPLPAVRVAMELADKSLGDLLRRLPIIILEDSTLHPSLPLLTWLMAAHSKDFEPNQFLINKVLCAIYEMASCPWQDLLTNKEDGTKRDFSFEEYHKPGLDNLLEDRETWIWSMLMRARYGGMGGDIQMLHSYARLWNRRLESDDNVPNTIKVRLAPSFSAKLMWSILPATIHQTSMGQSSARVTPMVENGLIALTYLDISTEGIDFHCSSILDVVLSDHELFDRCSIAFGDIATLIGLEPVPAAPIEKRAWLECVLKRCMWNYSAGINRRLPLISKDNNVGKKREDLLEHLWRSLVLPKTAAFAERYVKERLA